jgi:hypothetical protein
MVKKNNTPKFVLDIDPDAVTNFAQSDHRKSKFELRHGIKLGQVFLMTESEF